MKREKGGERSLDGRKGKESKERERKQGNRIGGSELCGGGRRNRKGKGRNREEEENGVME